MKKNKKQRKQTVSRLREIMAVLRKHKIAKGMTPEKLKNILEDLGPTYIKLGQIMSTRSDILPKAYCDELLRLCSNVTPMPFEQVEEVLESAFGCSWKRIFLKIDKRPLGSASIAQVHKAVLMSGKEVVIKVQRQGIFKTMSRDIKLLHKAVRLMPPTAIKDAINPDMVLSELWAVAQEEMDFLKEADNMEQFAKNNASVAFVATPRLYREYTSKCVLVMEYIQGFAIDDKKNLLDNGYDLQEIATKLVDNYMKQVIDDGFFHGDPHPGNVRIREGKIVWIDMGMMGTLTENDKGFLEKAVQGVANRDIGLIEDAVCAIGVFREKPDQTRLYEDIRNLMSKYGTTDMGSIDVADMMQDLLDVMKENRISMPNGLTMLARGLAQMEGVLAKLYPNMNMVEIASARMKARFFHNQEWKKELKTDGKKLYRSLHKALDVPGFAADILQGYLKGQTRINLDLHASKELSHLLRHSIRNVVLGLWVTALLISSSILCTTSMQPRIGGIPALGVLGYVMAVFIMFYTFVKHFTGRR